MIEVRARLAQTGGLFDGYNAEMRRVHRRNSDRLAQITDELQSWLGSPPRRPGSAGALFHCEA